MNKLKLFVEKVTNNLPQLVETLVKSSGKIIDKNNWLTSISDNFGTIEELGSTNLPAKILALGMKNAIRINDINESFQDIIAVTFFATFQEALEKHDIQLRKDQIEHTKTRIDVKISKETNLARKNLGTYETEGFDWNNFDFQHFLNNPIITSFRATFIDILQKFKCTQQQQNMLERHFKENLELNFLRLIERKSTMYEKVLKEIQNASMTKAQSIQIQRKRYDAKLSLMFEELVLNEAEMTLSDIYIRPRFKVFQSCFKKMPKCDNKFAILDENHRDLHHFINAFLNDKQQHKLLKAQHSNILFLLGNPGQGKTSFCKKLLYDAIVEHHTAGKVYFIRLKQIKNLENLANNPLNEIIKTLKKKHKAHSNLTEIDFQENSLLILDGLDELKMNKAISSAKIEEICKELIREAKEYSNLKIVITSRYYFEPNKIITRNALILQLDELTEEQQTEWLNKYRAFHADSVFTLEKLQAYKKRRYLNELLTQPILIHLIAQVAHKIDIDKNQSRTDIYKELFDSLIERKWSKDGQTVVLEKIDKDDLRTLIREMALSIFQSDYDYLHKAEIKKLNTLSDFEESLHLDDVLKGLMIAFYFQEVKKDSDDEGIENERNEDYAIEFMHKSLQEYMAAERVYHKLKDDFLSKKDIKKKRYFIKTTQDAYKVCAELFGPKMLSDEIMGYIKEMIGAEETGIREELAERLASFLDELIEIQFFDADSHKDIMRLTSKKHIDISMNIFYAFWHILLELKEGVNYVNDDNRENFVYLLRCLLPKEIHLKLSYQNLKKCDFSNIGFTGKVIEFNINKLEKAYLFLGQQFNNTILKYTSFNRANLSGAYLTEANLTEANLIEANLSRAYLTEANLSGANLTEANLTEAKNLTFSQLSKAKTLKDCKGLEASLEKRLRKEYPRLFEYPF